MNPIIVFSVIVGYFAILLLISHFTSRHADVNSFFTGNKQSPWYVVAFGMIGASLSGITFISVPGEVGNSNLFYFQLVLGYLLGYLFIMTVLLPLYYRLNVISIYSYLGQRFGVHAHKTGSMFFLLSQSIGASLRLFVVSGVLQLAFFDHYNIPYFLTVIITILLIWLYTHKAGIKTIVWTDTFQTFVMLLAVMVSIFIIADKLDMSFTGMMQRVVDHPYAVIFNWEWAHEKNFYKQLATGAFVAIAMTGLDQNEMQKNLTCRNLKDAQKNMFWFSISLVVTNLLFLTLGVLLYIYVESIGLQLPVGQSGLYENTDTLFPQLALNEFGPLAGIIFLLGIAAAAFSSADSALTSLTTAFYTDFVRTEDKNEQQKIRIRRRINVAFSMILVAIILLFRALNNDSVINTVFTIAGYTYGPLIGLYSFGLFTRLSVKDKWVPLVCVTAPVLSYLLNIYALALFDFKFGFTILLINGLITFLGLLMIQRHQT
jgi:Na+/proline symporter